MSGPRFQTETWVWWRRSAPRRGSRCGSGTRSPTESSRMWRTTTGSSSLLNIDPDCITMTFTQVLWHEWGVLEEHGCQSSQCCSGSSTTSGKNRSRIILGNAFFWMDLLFFLNSGCCSGHQHWGDPVPAQEALGLHLPPLQGGQPRLLTWPPLLLQPHLVLGMAGDHCVCWVPHFP